MRFRVRVLQNQLRLKGCWSLGLGGVGGGGRSKRLNELQQSDADINLRKMETEKWRGHITNHKKPREKKLLRTTKLDLNHIKVVQNWYRTVWHIQLDSKKNQKRGNVWKNWDVCCCYSDKAGNISRYHFFAPIIFMFTVSIFLRAERPHTILWRFHISRVRGPAICFEVPPYALGPAEGRDWSHFHEYHRNWEFSGRHPRLTEHCHVTN